MPARHTPLALLAALALACSLRPYTGESGTGTASSGDTGGTASAGTTTSPGATTSTSTTSPTTSTTASTTTGPVHGTWRGAYGHGSFDGPPFFATVFVDCETGQSWQVTGEPIPGCIGLPTPPGFFLHVAGVLHPDADGDGLDELEVTELLEGPCEVGTCEVDATWSSCGTWEELCIGGYIECDPFTQDCPDGEKCSPYSNDDDSNTFNSLKCMPVTPGAGGAGEPCTYDWMTWTDTCAEGHICWDVGQGVHECVPQCIGSYGIAHCPTCSSCLISGVLVLTLCLPDCSPLEDECPIDQVCVPDQANPWWLTCTWDNSGPAGQVFDPCTAVDTCDPGLWCAPPAHASECDPQAPGCCLPFCDMLQPTCLGAGQVCAPWYDADAPPTCDTNIGHCRLP